MIDDAFFFISFSDRREAKDESNKFDEAEEPFRKESQIRCDCRLF